jgi:hypothetical protein
MREHLRDAGETLVPPRGGPRGPLPALLVALTGLVDAFSYLELRRVFVATMTGAAVFLAFALGRAPGFVWWASLRAITAFAAGRSAAGVSPTRLAPTGLATCVSRPSRRPCGCSSRLSSASC